MSSAPTPGTAAPDATVQRKYTEERTKRLRTDGLAQFVELSRSVLKDHARDPWVDHAALNAAAPVLKDGDRVKHLVLGAGIFGLHFAVRLVDAGISPTDIRLVDEAAGFGGTWYWNRYPGLMCDMESYVYMPLLEKTGHMPKHKYSYGTEIREQAEQAAKNCGLADKAQWRTRVRSATWDETACIWTVAMDEYRGTSENSRSFCVHAEFLLLAACAFVSPKLPSIPGLDTFEGKVFHTARWDYSVTGGSQTDPSLTLLKDKVVGVIGTGASGVQVVPAVARWAKKLYVFQRTPASVDVRAQRETDPNEWKKIAWGPGWQRARQNNFNKFFTGWQSPDDVDLVDDACTRMRAAMALFGGRGPYGNILSPEQIPDHIAALHEADFERTERIRARVDEVIEDRNTAEHLKAWYPTWCKRPAIHDEYLDAFNRPNVTLVDTDGKGCSKLTRRGVVDANTGNEYPVDVLIFGTGFYVPIWGKGSPASASGMTIVGRNGQDMDEVWKESGPITLHGVAAPGFPNLFFAGTAQAAPGANYTYAADNMATHVAYIVAEARKRAEEPVVEVTRAAADAWAEQVAARAAFFSFGAGCTPSFFNAEGERDKPMSLEDQAMAAKGAIWSEGAETFVQVLETWREEGVLQGYVV